MNEMQRINTAGPLRQLGYGVALAGGWTPPGGVGAGTIVSIAECNGRYGVPILRSDAPAGRAEALPKGGGDKAPAR